MLTRRSPCLDSSFHFASKLRQFETHSAWPPEPARYVPTNCGTSFSTDTEMLCKRSPFLERSFHFASKLSQPAAHRACPSVPGRKIPVYARVMSHLLLRGFRAIPITGKSAIAGRLSRTRRCLVTHHGRPVVDRLRSARPRDSTLDLARSRIVYGRTLPPDVGVRGPAVHTRARISTLARRANATIALEQR